MDKHKPGFTDAIFMLCIGLAVMLICIGVPAVVITIIMAIADSFIK